MVDQPFAASSDRAAPWRVFGVWLLVLVTSAILLSILRAGRRLVGLPPTVISFVNPLVAAGVMVFAVIGMTRPMDVRRLRLVKVPGRGFHLVVMIIGGLAFGWVLHELSELIRPRGDEWSWFFSFGREDPEDIRWTEVLWQMAYAGFISSIAQELFYRGYIQTRLREMWSAPAAVLGAGICFGLAHYQFGAIALYFSGFFDRSSLSGGAPLSFWDLRWFLPAGFSLLHGLYYGYLTERTGSVLPAMACHITWNLGVSLGSYRLAYQFSSTEMLLVSSTLFVASVLYLNGEYPSLRASVQGKAAPCVRPDEPPSHVGINAPVFVICRNGDVLAFETAERAERYLESVDVENHEYGSAFDSEGRHLSLTVDSPTQRGRFLGVAWVQPGPVRLKALEGQRIDESELRAAIERAMAKLTGGSSESFRGIALPELAREALRLFRS